MFKLLVALL